MKTELWAKFLMLRCSDKGNARDFLRGLRLRREKLAQVGVTISDKDYLSTIISSLPEALSIFTSSQIAWTTQQSSKPMDVNVLMMMLLQEVNQQYLRTQKHKHRDRKGKDEKKNEVLVVDQLRGKKECDLSMIECWNCRDMGHFWSKCPKLKKVSTDSKKLTEVSSIPKNNRVARTASIVEEISDEEGAWMAQEILVEEVDTEEEDWFEEAIEEDERMLELVELSNSEDDKDPAMPELEELSDSEDEGEDGIVFDEDMEILMVEEVNEDVVKDFNNASGEVLVSMESTHMTGTAKLYDLGCMNHISPYQDQFQNFKKIIPRHFCAVNKQSFSTVGKGDLVIDIPNGTENSQLCLTEVLYSPKVSYTLVSVECLDECSFTITFGEGKCVLHGPDGAKVGEVLRNSSKIYKVEHEVGEAGVVEEKLSLDQFHQQMGHVLPGVARELVKDGMVVGVQLEYMPYGKPFFCSSCMCMKVTRKLVPKIREGERAKEFGGEVHLDLWGNLLVESQRGKSYYITFIDDKTHLTHLYLLKTKDKTAKTYKKYEA